MPIKILVLTTEEEIEREFRESLEKRQLEEKFFYWFPLSVRAWINLCNSKEYKNYSRSLRLSQRIAQKVAHLLGQKDITWISLGCGDGSKELSFLKAIQAANVKVSLRAVDFSVSLLEIACRKAQEEGIEVYGYKADIGVPHHLQAISAGTGSTTNVYSLLGGTLGAFEKRTVLLEQILRLMKPGDFFLVDGEIYDEQGTSAGYINVVNKQFAIAPLYAAGLEDSDGNLIFNLEADPEKEGFYRIRKQFHFTKDRSLFLAGDRLDYKAGDIIKMSYSYKYDDQAFMGFLAEIKEWKLAATYLSDDQKYLFALCRKEPG